MSYWLFAEEFSSNILYFSLLQVGVGGDYFGRPKYSSDGNLRYSSSVTTNLRAFNQRVSHVVDTYAETSNPLTVTSATCSATAESPRTFVASVRDAIKLRISVGPRDRSGFLRTFTVGVKFVAKRPAHTNEPGPHAHSSQFKSKLA